MEKKEETRRQKRNNLILKPRLRDRETYFVEYLEHSKCWNLQTTVLSYCQVCWKNLCIPVSVLQPSVAAGQTSFHMWELCFRSLTTHYSASALLNKNFFFACVSGVVKSKFVAMLVRNVTWFT
jgi:hypothetical protein